MVEAEAVAIQRADIEKVIEFDGRRLLTSHFFFADLDETPVAELRNGGMYFFDAAALAKRDAMLAKQRRGPRKDSAELAFVKQIAAELEAAGRRFRREVKTEGGRIDILIDENPPVIIEAKAVGDVRSIGHAIAQLFAYAAGHPSARLFIAVPGPIECSMLPLLSKCGVLIWR